MRDLIRWRKVQLLGDLQKVFQQHTGVQDYSASHTRMGGSLNALAYGVGSTEYAAPLVSGWAFGEVPESIRFELRGELRPGVVAKDVMLHILANHARRQETLDRVMEFGGPGLLADRPNPPDLPDAYTGTRLEAGWAGLKSRSWQPTKTVFQDRPSPGRPVLAPRRHGPSAGLWTPRPARSRTSV